MNFMEQKSGHVLYIDCSSGISGDMLLAAFFDLGLSLKAWSVEMEKLALEEEPEFKLSDTLSSGVRAKRFCIIEKSTSRPLRRLSDMERILDKSSIDDTIKDKSAEALRRLAECEAEIHGKETGEVHFHELSGLDTIIDVVGSFIALRLMGITRIISSPVNVGSGTIECEHGTLPVPAPATAKLLEGTPVYSRFNGELTTPTGALLVTQLASEFGDMPVMKLLRTGHGAGSREYGHPNILRLFLGECNEFNSLPGLESIYHISTNIDDMEPRLIGHLMEQLLKKGALDFYVEPVYMKKNRPGVVLNILCDEANLHTSLNSIMEETTTLGVRIQKVSRVCMERRIEMIDTPYGPIRIKIGIWNGEIRRANPEYEDCARAAAKTGLPLNKIMEDVGRIASGKFPGKSTDNM